MDEKEIFVYIKELEDKFERGVISKIQLFDLVKPIDNSNIYYCIRTLINKLNTDQLFELAKLCGSGWITFSIKLLIDKLTPDQLFELAKLSHSWYIIDCINLLINKLNPDQLFEIAKLSRIDYIHNCIEILINKLSTDQFFEIAKLCDTEYIDYCIELLIDKLTQDQFFELAKLSDNVYILYCIKLLINKLTPDQLFELAKLSDDKYIIDCIKLLDILTLDQLFELTKLTDKKLECLDIIRTNKEISIETLINLGFEKYLTKDIIYMIFTKQVYLKIYDTKPEFKNKLDELIWLIHVGHIEASAYGVKHEPDDIFEFIHSKQNNKEPLSELDIITLLHEVFYKNKIVHYDDADKLKRYLDITRLETEYGIN